MKKVKQQDIAKLAKVGISTVSMILGGQAHRFSRDVVKRVLKADRELSYSAGRGGNSAFTGHKDLLYCLYQSYITDSLPPFYSELAFAVERSLDGAYRDVIIKTIDKVDKLKDVINSRIDSLGGIILHGNYKDADLSFIPEDIPYIFMLPHFISDRAVSIELDYQSGTYELVKYLKELGHRNFAFLGVNRESRHFNERLKGFIIGVREFGLKETFPFEKQTKPGRIGKDFRETAKYFLKKRKTMKNPPTAIVCSCSNYASVLIQEALSSGLKIPRDMSVAGFNNIPTTVPPPMPLLSLDIPIKKVASAAVNILTFLKSASCSQNHRIVISCDKIFPGKSAGK